MDTTSSFDTLWRRRDLLKYMVVANLKVSRRDLMLGYFWWFLEPLLFTLLYWFLIELVFERGGPRYPLFLIAGLIPFRALIVSVAQATQAIRRKRMLIGQIAFPKLLLPVADVIANHIKLAAGVFVIIGFGMFYGIYPGWSTLWFASLAMVLQLMIVSGIAMLVAIAGVYVRDLSNLNQFLLRAWMYLTPILYSLERIPEQYQWLFWLNPMTVVVALYRQAFIGEGSVGIGLYAIAMIYAVALLFIGYVVFRRSEVGIVKRL